MKRKKRKNNEGSWGEKTIHGKKYLYFKKTYILSDGTKDEKYYYGATVREINEKKEEYETNLSRPSKRTLYLEIILQIGFIQKKLTLYHQVLSMGMNAQLMYGLEILNYMIYGINS